jgi:hypothetical protein
MAGHNLIHILSQLRLKSGDKAKYLLSSVRTLLGPMRTELMR